MEGGGMPSTHDLDPVFIDQVLIVSWVVIRVGGRVGIRVDYPLTDWLTEYRLIN